MLGRLSLAIALLASLPGCYRSHTRGEGFDAGFDAGRRPGPMDASSLDAGAGVDAGSDASVDAGPREVFDASMPPPVSPECAAGAPGPAPSEPLCVVPLRVLDVERSSPGCFVDAPLDGETGVLVYECGGGAAQLDIAGRRFSGEVLDDRVALCLGTRFPFADGCDWLSTQQIYGDLRSAELVFVYRERPDPPMPTCARPCEAHARVAL